MMRRMIDLGAAIKEIDEFSKWGVSGQEMPIIDGVCKILNSLPRTLIDDQPNDPLTQEELREMDGEPVWIVRLDAPKRSRWYLIDGYSQERLLFRVEYGGYMRWDEMGAVWLAYRRKPEEASPRKGTSAANGQSE